MFSKTEFRVHILLNFYRNVKEFSENPLIFLTKRDKIYDENILCGVHRCHVSDAFPNFISVNSDKDVWFSAIAVPSAQNRPMKDQKLHKEYH